MADVKISALPLATTPLAGTEVLPIVQSATTDQVSVANLTAGRAVSAASLTLTTTPLAVGSGGTGLGGASPFVSSGLLYASSASALTTSANLSYSSDILLVGGSGNPQIKATSSTSGSSGAFVVDGTGATSYPSYNINQSGVNLWSMQLRADTNLHFYRQSGSGNVIFDNSAVGFLKAPLFTVDIAGTFGLSSNLAATLPTASNGLVIGQNFSNAQAEIDFFHNDSAYIGGNGGFRFYQRTGASTSNIMFLINQNTFTAYTTNTSRLTIDSSGQVGIGTASASGYILDVNSGASRFGGGFTYLGSYNSGGTNFPAAQAAGAVSWNQSGGAQETNFWNCATAASRAFTFYQLTTSGSAAALLLRIDSDAGGVYATTVGASGRAVYIDNQQLIGGLTSVRAAKMNITPVDDADWINDLNPVTFNFRLKAEDGTYTDTPDGPKQYGLIADEMEAVNRDLCIYDVVDGEEKLVGIHYDRLVTPLIKYAQTLAARIAVLEARK